MVLRILEYSHQQSQWKKSFSMHFYKHASVKEEKPSFMLEEGQTESRWGFNQLSKERLKKRSGISWKGFIVMGCELEKRRIIGSILCNPHVKWLYAGLKNGSIFRCPCGKVERQAKNIRAAEAAWVPQPAKRQKAASLKSLWAPYPFGTVRKPCEGIVGGMRCIHKAIPCLLEAMRDTQLKLKP